MPKQAWSTAQRMMSAHPASSRHAASAPPQREQPHEISSSVNAPPESPASPTRSEHADTSEAGACASGTTPKVAGVVSAQKLVSGGAASQYGDRTVPYGWSSRNCIPAMPASTGTL